MGMKAQIALSAVVGFVVIGVVSANAGTAGNTEHHGTGSGFGSGHGSGSGSGSVPHGGKGPSASAGNKVTFPGDGDFRVGADIAPGTYRSTGNGDGSCHWERTKDAGHSPDSIIADSTVTGTAVVTISAGDGYFRTSGSPGVRRGVSAAPPA